MKSITLIKNLRQLFGFLRVAAFILLLEPPLSLFFGDSCAAGTVSFALSPSAVTFKAPVHSTQPTLEISDLQGLVKIRTSAASDPELEQLDRWTRIPFVVLAGLIIFGLSDTAWRLFRNAERGEIFTSANIGLMRRLGWVLIVSSFVLVALHTLLNFYMGKYLAAHVSLAAGELTRVSGWAPLFSFAYEEMGSIVLGVALLILAEVFAQGLALKQEADLTV